MSFIDAPAPKKWRARYKNASGKWLSRTFTRKVDAENHLTKVKSEILRGEYLDPAVQRVTVDQAAGEWIQGREDRGRKPKTINGYRGILGRHIEPAFRGRPLMSVTPGDVDQWLATLAAKPLSESQVRQCLSALSGIYKLAARRGYVLTNPATTAELPSFDKVASARRQFLTAEQVITLAEAMPSPYDTLVYVLAFGGLRFGEAAALRRRSVLLDQRRLVISESVADINGHLLFGSTKNRKSRPVHLPASLCMMLKGHLFHYVRDEDDALVFTSSTGATLRNGNFRKRIWLPAVEAAGLPSDLRIHDLRHTCASLMIAQGIPPMVVSEHLGHSSVAVTLGVYSHLFDDAKEKAAAVMEGLFPNVGRTQNVLRDVSGPK
ncbi:MAG TPA: site-specific integrase [Actinomycetota bacterium]|nr:site-specific integrase [Actinomycetota bacterium]